MLGAAGPLCAAELKELLGDIGIATVYRLLNEGVANGKFLEVELPGATKRFEVAGKPHHHHFECQTCHRVYDIPGCPGRLERFVPEGFELEHHELILSGRCADCTN